MGGARPRSWASVKLPSNGWTAHCISFLGTWVGWVGRCQEAGYRWAPFLLDSWVGWVGRGNGAGFPFWAPGLDGWAAASFILPFWAAGSDGWAAANELGFYWAPFMFPLLGRMGGSWVGWVGRGKEAGLLLGSLFFSFLGSWVGWVGRCQEAGLSLGSLHVSNRLLEPPRPISRY